MPKKVQQFMNAEYLSPIVAARSIGVSRSFIYDTGQEGDLKCVKLGSKILILRDDVINIISSFANLRVGQPIGKNTTKTVNGERTVQIIKRIIHKAFNDATEIEGKYTGYWKSR